MFGTFFFLEALRGTRVAHSEAERPPFAWARMKGRPIESIESLIESNLGNQNGMQKVCKNGMQNKKTVCKKRYGYRIRKHDICHIVNNDYITIIPLVR